MNFLIVKYLFLVASFLHFLPYIVGQTSSLDQYLHTGNLGDEEENADPRLLEKVRRRDFFKLREDKLARKIISRVRRREEDDLLLDLIEQDGLEEMFSSPTVLKKTIKANPMLLSFKALREIHEEEDTSELSPERGLKALENVRLGFRLGMGLVKKLKTKGGKEELFNSYKLTDEDKKLTSEVSERRRQIAHLIETVDQYNVEGQKMLRDLIFEDQIGGYVDHEYFSGKDGELPEYAKFNKNIMYEDPFLRRLFEENEPSFEEFLQHPGAMIKKLKNQVRYEERDNDFV